MKFECVKLATGGAISALLTHLYNNALGSAAPAEDNNRLVLLLIAFMAADSLFGHLRAVKNKKWKSRNARWGFVGKLVELILIALMCMCEWTFGIDWLVGVSVGYFIICEGASIAENVSGLSDSFPKELAVILENGKSNMVRKIMKLTEKLLQEIFKGDNDENN